MNVTHSLPTAAVQLLNFFNARCLLDGTLKAVGPFCLVCMPREVKYFSHGIKQCVTCRGLIYTVNLA